jgi:hypothetical protein
VWGLRSWGGESFLFFMVYAFSVWACCGGVEAMRGCVDAEDVFESVFCLEGLVLRHGCGALFGEVGAAGWIRGTARRARVFTLMHA